MRNSFLHLIFILSFLTGLFYSCEEPSGRQSQYFIKYYGGDKVNNANSMQLTSDGGAVIVGTTETDTRGMDVILFKVDEFGNYAWSPKMFGSEEDDFAHCIKVLSDGYIIAGSSKGFDNTADLDAYVIRTDLQGKVQWEKTYENILSSRQSDNEAFSIEQTDEGGFIFVGYAGDSEASRRASIVVIDADGNILKRSERGVSYEKLSAIHKLKDGNYIVAGTRLNADLDYFTLIINKDGNDLSNSNLGLPNRNDELSCACSGNDNSVYLIGTSTNLTNDDTGNESGMSILLYKYDISTDQTLWSKQYNESVDLQGVAVRELSNGTIVMLGNRIRGNDKNIVLWFLSREGNILSMKEFGDSGDQSASDLLLSNGQILILGKNKFDETSLITLIKTDSEGKLWK